MSQEYDLCDIDTQESTSPLAGEAFSSNGIEAGYPSQRRLDLSQRKKRHQKGKPMEEKASKRKSITLLAVGVIMACVSISHLMNAPDIRTNNTAVQKSTMMEEEALMELQDSNTDTADVVKEATTPPLLTTPDGDVNTDLVGWLSMGNAKNYPRLKQRFDNIPNTKFLFHSFDEPCDGCIYKPKTSFAEGRHILLQEALRDPQIKYFVLFDDDVQLLCGDSLKQAAIRANELPSDKTNLQLPVYSETMCWQSFTRMLLEPTTTHPFIKPLYTALDLRDSFSVKYQSCCDENFKAFHRDYLWFFYPSSYYKEDISWYFNGRSKMYLARKCWPYAWKVDGNWGVDNPEHRGYPKNEAHNSAQEVLDYSYPELGPWDISKYPGTHRCEISDDVQPNVDPHCEQALKARYKRWLDGTFEPEISQGKLGEKPW